MVAIPSFLSVCFAVMTSTTSYSMLRPLVAADTRQIGLAVRLRAHCAKLLSRDDRHLLNQVVHSEDCAPRNRNNPFSGRNGQFDLQVQQHLQRIAAAYTQPYSQLLQELRQMMLKKKTTLISQGWCETQPNPGSPHLR